MVHYAVPSFRHVISLRHCQRPLFEPFHRAFPPASPLLTPSTIVWVTGKLVLVGLCRFCTFYIVSCLVLSACHSTFVVFMYHRIEPWHDSLGGPPERSPG